MALFDFLKKKKEEPVKRIGFNQINIFVDEETRKFSEISRDLKRKGISIDFRDLFIASICIVNNCNLATFNKKHFEHTKDLELV